VTIKCPLHSMAPEIWHAEDSSIAPVSYQSGPDGVSSPIHLDPYEAIFLVFSKSAIQSRRVPSVKSTVLATLSGPWNVEFQPGRGAPKAATLAELAPWNESQEPGMKYFSGHATYKRTISVPASALHAGRHILLDLGEVREIAEVSLNGQTPKIVWHSPFLVDITTDVKPGENSLSITVTNLWPNRLIGDKQPGANRYTYAPQSPYGATSPLLRSGLIGPVRLIERR
jgi:hypothetical protein